MITDDTADPRIDIVHRTPTPYAEGGDGTTQCCGWTPFELHLHSRMTNDDALVTCEKWRS